jgi:hypothetical protein
LKEKIIYLELSDVVSLSAKFLLILLSRLNNFKNLELLDVKNNTSLKNINENLLSKVVDKLQFFENKNITILSPYSY